MRASHATAELLTQFWLTTVRCDPSLAHLSYRWKISWNLSGTKRPSTLYVSVSLYHPHH